MLLASLGVVGNGVAIGPLYYFGHTLILFLGTPALMNVLTLSNPPNRYALYWFSVPACTALAFVLVLQQYAVSEALYGIDGVAGPFSEIDGY
jgi:hypothetical protein